MSRQANQMISSMILNNPQTQELAQSNPDLAELLQDPTMMDMFVRVANNPSLMSQMMQGVDNAISNIENIPGGTYKLLQARKSFDSILNLRGNQIKYDESVTNEHFHQDKPLDTPFDVFAAPAPPPLAAPFAMPLPQYPQPPLIPPFYAAPRAPQPPQPAPRPADPAIAHYLQVLHDLGFTDDAVNEQVIALSNGDLEKAIELLTQIYK